MNQKNVFGEKLESSALILSRGFLGMGFVTQVHMTVDLHTVCALVTNEFLEFSKIKKRQ